MSTKSTVEAGNTAAYQEKLLGLLGGQDPLEVLERTPDFVDEIVRENSATVLRTRPYAGKWTPLEIIGHLIDSEYVYSYRVRLILCEDRPTILGMSQDHWVSGQRYNDDDPRGLAADFRHLRSITTRLWRKLRPGDHERVGLHNERGAESLGLMIRMEAGHDLSHIDQVSRYLAAIAEGVRAG